MGYSNSISRRPYSELGEDDEVEVLLERVWCCSWKGRFDFVYALRAGDAVKIGRSRDPRKRIRQLKNMTVEETTLVALVPADDDKEEDLHRQFRHLHIKGEWFRATDELVDALCREQELGDRTAANMRAVIQRHEEWLIRRKMKSLVPRELMEDILSCPTPA